MTRHTMRDLRERDTPYLLITIDTEGDSIWSAPKALKTENARFLPRFQAVCERFGFRPTWLTNYEMATDSAFVEFARDLVRAGSAEVGAHPHAWNSPPIVPLGDGTGGPLPYLTEYPESVILAKMVFLTELLENTFGVKMRSHRGGRWAFNEYCARVLIKLGYDIDCTVTPGHSWANVLGGYVTGSDYSRSVGAWPYFIDPDDIRRPGASLLLEAPMTILPPRYDFLRRAVPHSGVGSRIQRKLFP